MKDNLESKVNNNLLTLSNEILKLRLKGRKKVKAKPESKMMRENLLTLSGPKGTSLIMVLNDGETYMPLTGSMIVAAPSDISDNDLEIALKENKLETIIRFEEA
jgi:hypothetical protein